MFAAQMRASLPESPGAGNDGHRYGIHMALLAAGLGALLIPGLVCAQDTWNGAPQGESGNLREACLLQVLKRMDPNETVAALRRRCEDGTSPPFALDDPEKRPDLARTPDEIARTPSDGRSLFQTRLRSEMRALFEPFALLPHRPNYLLPYTFHGRPAASRLTSGAAEAAETHFQVSFKFPVSRPWFDGRVIPLFGYTSRAWWQVYDGDRSRPFREYNHEPEFLLAFPAPETGAEGWLSRLVTLGFNHQSNGRSGDVSRSWNRVTAELFFDRGTTDWASIKLWHRLGERKRRALNDSGGDDNPDILTYLGNFEVKLGRAIANGFNLTLTARQSLRKDGKGAVQVDWSRPVGSVPTLRWYVQLFSGYGESLIDYNVKVDRVGVGIMLQDWF